MDPESEKQGSKSLEEKRRLQQGLGLQKQSRWGSQEEEPAPPHPLQGGPQTRPLGRKSLQSLLLEQSLRGQAELKEGGA